MRHRLVSIGATVAAVSVAVAFVIAQGTTGQGQAGGPPAVQGPPPAGAGQIGPGRGRGQGQGPGMGHQPAPQGAQGGPMMGRGRAMGPQGRDGGFAGLDLTADQRGKVNELTRAGRDQSAPLEDELEFTRKTLHREVFADKRDAAKIATLATKAASLEKQLADLNVKTMTAVADVLTAEQRETMRLRDGRAGMGRGAGPFQPGPR
jgi:Spy/CpxP family protein refolding chaperone